MTVERKVVIGLDEIKAIIFQCIKCGSRMCIPPDKFDSIPSQFPNGHAMLTQFPPDFAGSTLLAFLTGLRKLREPLYETAGFKIFLEFEEPKP